MVKNIENRSQWLWMHCPTREEFKRFRNGHGWSAREFERELGHVIGRARPFHISSIKHIEGGSKQASPNIIRAFYKLREEKGEGQKKIVEAQRVVLSRFKIPMLTKASTRTRKCRGHRLANFFGSANQVYCGTTQVERNDCKKLWLKKRRRKDARARKKKRTELKRKSTLRRKIKSGRKQK